MTAFTRIGTALWDWDAWTKLEMPVAQILWLALYTTAEAKRHAPGLWQGGISMMAESSRLPADEVVSALDRLLDRELVEYDPKHRVARLCALPDPGERPSNGNVILGWWTKFKTVPECPVRDAHVRTLEWIMVEGSRRANQALTPGHLNAWQTTFGTVAVPAHRHRGIRSLVNSDTSTQVQPSLFGAPLAGNGSAALGASDDPQNPQQSVDNSAALQQSNKITGPETVPPTVPGTVGGTNRIQDPGSRIQDLSLPSGEGGRGGGHETGKPVLTLVPPYTAADVIRELANGNWDSSADRSHLEALSALVPRWVASAITMDDIAVLREYSAISGQRLSTRLLVGCDIAELLSKAHRTVNWRDVQAKAMAQSLP